MSESIATEITIIEKVHVSKETSLVNFLRRISPEALYKTILKGGTKVSVKLVIEENIG